MSKIVFFFAGTGRTAEEYKREHEGFLDFPGDVIRIYVNGCQDRRVGGLGGALSPDLTVATRKIAGAFTSDKNCVNLNLQKLQNEFGSAIIIDTKINNTASNSIESIALEGYSRGAVQTLAVASELNKFNLPIDIIANQPVTGEKYNGKPLFKTYKDVSACINIRSATTLYAMHETRVNPLHDCFFTTMKPVFGSITQSKEILLPQQIHKRSAVLGQGEKLGQDLISTPAPYHIAEALAQHGYAYVKSDQDTTKAVTNARACQLDWYSSPKNRYYFTPFGFSQKIYGIEGDYREHVTESYQFLNMNIAKANQWLATVNPEPPTIALLLDGDSLKKNKDKFENATRAVAINVMHEARNGDTSDLKELIGNDSNSLQLSKIIKHVDNVCLHLQLRKAMKSGDNKKSLIEENAKKFKVAVFLACAEYLKAEADKKDINNLINMLTVAETQFVSSALSRDRKIYAWALRPIGEIIGAVLLLPTQIKNALVTPPQDTFIEEPINFFSVRSKKLLKALKNQILSDVIKPKKN